LILQGFREGPSVLRQPFYHVELSVLGCQNQIGRLEHAQAEGHGETLSDLRVKLKKAEQDDLPLQRENELFKAQSGQRK